MHDHTANASPLPDEKRRGVQNTGGGTRRGGLGQLRSQGAGRAHGNELPPTNDEKSLFPEAYERYGGLVFEARMLRVTGRVEQDGQINCEKLEAAGRRES